jgi:lipopolysaccharide transport system ATP-binding protein
MSKPIIEVNNISKKYKIGIKEQSYYPFRDALVSFIKNPFILFKQKQLNANGLAEDEFWALRDISFKVMPGEVVGIIGRNGAGKSTLLKLLSQITPPTTGKIILRGRVASLLEVGTGFNPELTGRENIYLNGSILGMKQKEIKKKFDEIVEFADIGKFLDTPVKHYSSGMYMRLAFAVAAHLEPEILIVDEVLAVGDVQFQKKSLNKMGDVAKRGRTVLFVSHNISAIKQLCKKCLLIENGQIVINSYTARVIDRYLDHTINIHAQHAEIRFKENKEKKFQILSVRLLNNEGKISKNFSCDNAINIEIICISREAVPSLYGYMNIFRKDGTSVLVSDTYDVYPNCLDCLKPDYYKLLIKIPPRTLGHGDYLLYFNFTSMQNTKSYNVDSPRYVCSFSIDDNTTQRGNTREGFFSTLLKWELSPATR